MSDHKSEKENVYQPKFTDDDIKQLMVFYGVQTERELIEIQARSIKRLQGRLNERPRSFPMPPTRFA